MQARWGWGLAGREFREAGHCRFRSESVIPAQRSEVAWTWWLHEGVRRLGLCRTTLDARSSLGRFRNVSIHGSPQEDGGGPVAGARKGAARG